MFHLPLCPQARIINNDNFEQTAKLRSCCNTIVWKQWFFKPHDWWSGTGKQLRQNSVAQALLECWCDSRKQMRRAGDQRHPSSKGMWGKRRKNVARVARPGAIYWWSISTSRQKGAHLTMKRLQSSFVIWKTIEMTKGSSLPVTERNAWVFIQYWIVNDGSNGSNLTTIRLMKRLAPILNWCATNMMTNMHQMWPSHYSTLPMKLVELDLGFTHQRSCDERRKRGISSKCL